MKTVLKVLFFLIGILIILFSGALVLSKFLMATEHISGTDKETRDSIRLEPVRHKYIKLTLPNYNS